MPIWSGWTALLWCFLGLPIEPATLGGAMSQPAIEICQVCQRVGDVRSTRRPTARESIRPALRSASQSLELGRAEGQIRVSFRPCGRWACPLALSWLPAIHVGEVCLVSTRGRGPRRGGRGRLQSQPARSPSRPDGAREPVGRIRHSRCQASGEVRPIRLLLVDGAESVLEGRARCSGQSPQRP